MRCVQFAAGSFALLLCASLLWGSGSAEAEGPTLPESPLAQKIILIPQEGKMVCVARVPGLGDQRFAMGLPESIGEASGLILNFPEVDIHWEPPNEHGAVYCTWTTAGRISYDLWVVPYEDYVDILMTIRNLSGNTWLDVFTFNCLNPVAAPEFLDWALERTWMSKDGAPFRMDGTTRVNDGPNKTVQFYVHEDYEHVSRFVTGWQATSPDKTDCSYIVTMAADGQSYMAGTSPKAAFLFDNLDRCCIHSAPNFGDMPPGSEKTLMVRYYMAQGTLADFLLRYFNDFPTDVRGFRIKNAAGEMIGIINDAGTLIVAGAVSENGTPSETGGSDFLVRDSEGAVVAAMDSAGNLALAGSLHEEQTLLAPPEGSFVVRNDAGEPVAYVSPTGDLYLKGIAVGNG